MTQIIGIGRQKKCDVMRASCRGLTDALLQLFGGP